MLVGMGRAPAAMAGAPVALALLLVTAFKEGPLPGHTGGFGEPTCHACHFDHDLDASGGVVQISGLPESYTAGAQYAMRVVLARPGTRRAGFQVAVRFVDGPRAGQDAGRLEALDDRVQIVPSPDGRVHYAQHTQAGGRATTAGRAEWSVRWTAPSADARGPVVAHVAANAADGDDSPLGDWVYTAEGRGRPE
jgi:hypothetical protein